MTSRVKWGAWHASVQVDTQPPYFFWNSIPWLGIALLKIGPIKAMLNWPVWFHSDDSAK
jgi:hypothetical protein